MGSCAESLEYVERSAMREIARCCIVPIFRLPLLLADHVMTLAISSTLDLHFLRLSLEIAPWELSQ